MNKKLTNYVNGLFSDYPNTKKVQELKEEILSNLNEHFEDAVKNGADEIDMVINIGFLKDKRYEEIEEEIRQVHAACDGRILKVIIETCLLTEEEKIKMCEIVTKAGAEFIKTSTGFSTGGATFADVELMRKHVGEQVKVKAAGGISSLDDAEKFMELGATRLGTSRIVKIVKNQDTGSGY